MPRLAALVLMISCLTTAPAAGQTVSTLTEPFNATADMAVGPDGTLYVADFGVNLFNINGTTVYRVTPEGVVTVFTTGLSGPTGNTFDAQGNLYQSNFVSQTISRITPAGVVSTFADGEEDGVAGPGGLAINSQGNLFVANCDNNSVAKVGSSVFITSPLLICPNGLTIDKADNLYATNFGNGSISKITPGGQVSLLATLPSEQTGHLTFANGKLYVVSRNKHAIYEVTLSGEVSVLAGTGERGRQDGPALQAEFSLPYGIAASVTGDTLYVNDSVLVEDFVLHPNVIRMIVGVNSPATNIEDLTEEPPARFALRQNYPNPFQATTRIGFAVSEPQQVTLEVYDVFGRRLATLVDAYQAAGVYEARFDARGFASGIYFYRLRAGHFNKTKTMLLVR